MPVDGDLSIRTEIHKARAAWELRTLKILGVLVRGSSTKRNERE